MPQISYRANLSAAIFPLSLSSAGRTVIVPGPDNNYDRRVDPEGEQKDAGIPQAIYLENVMPTANGYQSITWQEYNDLAAPPSGEYFIGQIPIKWSGGNQAIRTATLVWDSIDGFKFSSVGVGIWQSVVFVGTVAIPDIYPELSYAVVRGVCYVLIPGTTGTELYTAELVGSNLVLTNVSASVTHITLNNIIGICGSYNYLLAFDAAGTVFWSSTTNPLDFAPSLVSGAGSATPNNLLGNFQYAYSTTEGFYIFSFVGVTLGIYTGNSRYPWKFVPVSGTNTPISKAIQDINAEGIFTYDGSNNVHYIEKSSATLVAPELSAYLKQLREDYTYNFSSHTLIPFQPSDFTNTKLYFFYGRYLLASVGGSRSGSPTAQTKYKIALVYDTVLKRYGRIVWDHTHILAHLELNVGESTIALMDAYTGKARAFIWGIHNSNLDVNMPAQSVLILGKFKYVRGRRIELQEGIFDGQFSSSTQKLMCKVYPSNDLNVLGAGDSTYIIVNNKNTLQISCRCEGESLGVGLVGKFSVDSASLTFTVGGGR